MTKRALTTSPGRSERTNEHAFESLERVAATNLSCCPATADPEPEWAGGVRDRAAVLRLQDLVADENGEIVIAVGDGLRTIVLETDAQVVDRGTLPVADVGSDGVSRHSSYLSLDSGTTVYFPADVDVLVSMPIG